MAAAAKKGDSWLSRVKRTEVASMRLEEDGPSAVLLVETTNKTLRFNCLQQACAILSNSKLKLIQAQHLITRLYQPGSVLNAYTDTVSGWGREACRERVADRLCCNFRTACSSG